MPERLLAIAGNHHIDLSRFKLEITESALADRNVLQNNMKRLQEQHAVFSLDDFGTGYSNLMRVLRFPFSDVKLDMSFVQAYFSRHNRLLPAIIDGFQSFGVQVTAEGSRPGRWHGNSRAWAAASCKDTIFPSRSRKRSFWLTLRVRNRIQSIPSAFDDRLIGFRAARKIIFF